MFNFPGRSPHIYYFTLKGRFVPFFLLSLQETRKDLITSTDWHLGKGCALDIPLKSSGIKKPEARIARA
jgi:hypothetical protein